MFETDPRTVSNYHSEASKGNEYHEIHYMYTIYWYDWNMSIKITNTVKDHYSTEVLQQQQQQQLTLLRNRYLQFQ